MATIVWHEKSQGKFVLLGAGFGAFQSVSSSYLFGDLAPNKSSGQHALVCVADAYSKIGWVESSELTVISVDGYSPADLLK